MYIETRTCENKTKKLSAIYVLSITVKICMSHPESVIKVS